MPDQRPAQSWVFPHALVAFVFKMVWLQSNHNLIQYLPIPNGHTSGVLSRATVRTVLTAQYAA